MISAAWKWALLVVGVIGAVLAGLVYVISGVAKESNMSAYSAYFPEIVSRAIQLENSGEIRVPLINWYHADPVFPEKMIAARKLIRELYLSGADIDCSLPLEMPAIDPFEFTPAIGVLLEYRPLQYLVVFHGKTPDVSPFLEGAMLAKPQVQISSTSSADGRGAFDLVEPFRTISRAHRKGVSWRSGECEDFSFVVFGARKK